MFRRLCVWMLIASPTLALAASKEIQELQRDIAQLQDTVRQLQRSQDEKFAALQVLVQQAVNASNEASKSVAVIQSGLQQNLRDQEGKVVAPVVGLASRMDQMSNDFRTLQGAVSDLTSLVGKIQTQLTDVNNALKAMQTPAAPPPPAGGSAPPPAGGSAEAAPGIPPMSATDMFATAERDRGAGRYDLALQDYADYLKYYGNTAQAPDAQFYIGYIHFLQKNYETAAQDFDLVLEKYPSGNKRVPQAFYYKGLSLERVTGHKTEAAGEFRQLIMQYPNDENAKRACTELQQLGYNCGSPQKAAPKGAAKKKR